MAVIILASAGAALGTVVSALGLIWSAIKVASQKKAVERREENEQPGQIDVELSGGRSISINIGSATPEELVNFIDRIKAGSASSEGKVA
jgi:hypothetical protein